MAGSSRYTAHAPDARGFVAYSGDEHAVWSELMTAQRPQVERYACRAYRAGLARVDLPRDRIPQCAEVSARLAPLTGWRVTPVPALIDDARYFAMLRAREFPAAAFIRARSELGYLQEPDIFHELFGHAPLLADARVADLMAAIGEAARGARDGSDLAGLARLNWFTIEFGLVREGAACRAYGAGLVSSIDELAYSVTSDAPVRKPFDIIELLRTPYRIDILQPVYFVLESLDQLAGLARRDLLALVRRANALGLRAPRFPARSAA